MTCLALRLKPTKSLVLLSLLILKLKIIAKYIGFIVILSYEIISTHYRSFSYSNCWNRH